MNTSADNHDDGSELETVMGAYFDALLHEAPIKPVDAKPVVTPESRTDLNSTASTVAVDALPADLNVPAASPLDPGAATEGQSAPPSYQLIQVGGLTLGLATDAIAEISTLPTITAPPSGAPAWVLGTYTTAQGVLTVVDTATLLVPNNARRIAMQGSRVLQLKGQRWALACDAIGLVLTPDPGQVTWRGAEGKRLWLAGTLRTPSCALLDISELIKLLEG